jgi:hypothetical protein
MPMRPPEQVGTRRLVVLFNDIVSNSRSRAPKAEGSVHYLT